MAGGRPWDSAHSASPILVSFKHNLDVVAPFVSALIFFFYFRPRIQARILFVFQRVSESVSVLATITEQPFDVWQAAEQCQWPI